MSKTIKTIVFIFALFINPLSQANELIALDPGSKEFKLHIENNQWLVVKIWSSACHICNREAHNYVDFYEFGADENTTIVGVSLDGSDTLAAQSFIDRHSVSYPNFIIDFESGSRWYKELTGETFWGTPGFLIFDPTGQLRAQQIGAVPVDTIEAFIAENSQ